MFLLKKKYIILLLVWVYTWIFFSLSLSCYRWMIIIRYQFFLCKLEVTKNKKLFLWDNAWTWFFRINFLLYYCCYMFQDDGYHMTIDVSTHICFLSHFCFPVKSSLMSQISKYTLIWTTSENRQFDHLQVLRW